MSGFDGEDNLFGFAATRFVVKIEPSVDAAICTFLLFRRTSSNETERPPLKLIRIVSGEFPAPQINRRARRLFRR
jgi:hypothetical protein